MVGLGKSTMVGISVAAITDLAVTVLVNLYTASIGLTLATLVAGAFLITVGVRFVNEYVRLQGADAERRLLLARIAAMVPFSARSRPREGP